jgi:HEAT repeats
VGADLAGKPNSHPNGWNVVFRKTVRRNPTEKLIRRNFTAQFHRPILPAVKVDPPPRPTADSNIPAGRFGPASDPISPLPIVPRSTNWRGAVLATVALFALLLFARTTTVQAAWTEISQFLKLTGKPEPASANVLSEHEIEGLSRMPAQRQAQLLLERSINHYDGANGEIAERVDSWRGRIKLDQPLNSLFMTAINSDDLRVRAAALEIDLACRNLEKTSATIDRLEPDARFGEQGLRANALWDLGLLGNRGVEPGRVGEILLASLHDSNENVRYWAVEGLAYLGTDEVVAPLLETFHDDTSPAIRERAACSLAQSGMLSEKQRRTAVPRLLDFAEDPALDPATRGWVFQALRDITGQNLPHDAAAWRNWYNMPGAQWKPVTRD